MTFKQKPFWGSHARDDYSAERHQLVTVEVTDEKNLTYSLKAECLLLSKFLSPSNHQARDLRRYQPARKEAAGAVSERSVLQAINLALLSSIKTGTEVTNKVVERVK